MRRVNPDAEGKMDNRSGVTTPKYTPNYTSWLFCLVVGFFKLVINLLKAPDVKRVGAMDSPLIAFAASPDEPSLGSADYCAFIANILYQFWPYNSPFTTTLHLPEHEHFLLN